MPLREKTVATTCDYCQKPLSLMRRLRGEQFCSVEHLDLYTTQQAEFALQRLAASVEERPATHRPPALLKRLARTPVDANGHAIGNGHKNSNGTLTQEAPAADLPSNEFLRVSGALSEPPIVLRRIDPPSPQIEPKHEPEPDYPMASFLAPTPSPSEPTELSQAVVEPSIAEPTFLKPRLRVEPQFAPPAAPLQAFSAEPRIEEPSLIAAEPNGELMELLVTPAESALLMNDSDLLIQPPEPVSVLTTSLRPLSGNLELAGVTQLHQVTNFEPEIAPPADGRPFSELPLAPRIPWIPKPLANASSLGPMFGPILGATDPELVREFPPVPEWSPAQSFAAPAVALPASEPKTSSSTPRGDEPWMASSGKVQAPRMPGVAPHFSKSGPNFGWELTRPKTGLDLASLDPATSVHKISEAISLPSAPQIRRILADLGNTTDQWSRPRNAAPFEVTAEPNVDASKLSPRVRDFRARVEARLEAVRHHEAEGWATPRIDSTMLEPSVPVNSRPSSSPIDIRLTSVSSPIPTGLSHASGAVRQHSLLEGPALPMSEPSSWSFPTGEPQPGIALTPTSALLHGTLSSKPQRSSEKPATPLADLQPLRYRPVSLVVVPSPNYRLQAAVLPEEFRFVAQAPTGIYRLPHTRQTGYRMPGPYPKVPRQLPEHYLAKPTTQLPPPIADVPLVWAHTRNDEASLPRLERPAPTRLHPADYFTWPAIKTPRTDRILPREHDTVLGPAVGEDLTARRFGPARVGLQRNTHNADVLPRTGA